MRSITAGIPVHATAPSIPNFPVATPLPDGLALPFVVAAVLGGALVAPAAVALYRRISDADVLRARPRRAVLRFFRARPGATIADAAAALGLDYTTVRHHARVLGRFGLVRAERSGRRVGYWGDEPDLDAAQEREPPRAEGRPSLPSPVALSNRAGIRRAVPADEERPPGPRLHVIVLRARGDLAARAIADEAATLLRGTGREVVAADALPPEPADGLLVVATAAADIAPLVADASSYRGRAIALAIVADEVRDGAALALRLRKALRAAGAFVLDRQLVVPRSAFGVYGLESEPHRERLDALAILLEHDADRLLAKREGWFEPGEMHPSELLTREPEDAEDG